MTGYQLRDILEFKFKIQVEKATLKAVMITCHPNVTEDHINKLIEAVKEIANDSDLEDEVALRAEEDEEPLYVNVLR